MDDSLTLTDAGRLLPVHPRALVPVAMDVAVLGRLASITLHGPPLGLVLERVALIASEAIPGAAAVSVTVVRGRTASSAGFTGAVAAALDERQYETGFGPCLSAAASTGEVVVADTASSSDYPGFAATAAHHGIGSAVAIGLAVAGSTTAALNVYRSAAADDEAALALTTRVARVFAPYAAVAVSNAAALDAERSTAAQLGTAMATRAGIEQAKGVLMAQRGITAEVAFAALVAMSQATNVKVVEVAAAVVATSTTRTSAQG